MGTLDLILFLVIGLIAGWAAGQVLKGKGFGLIGDLIVGVIGAFLGGWLFSLVDINLGGIIGRLVIAFVGAVVFLYLIRIIKKA